jgi:hypothetical protein
MATRGRPPKAEQEGLQPITVLIPLDLKRALEAASKTEEIPLSQIVRRRLAQQESKPGGALEDDLSPRARAIGRFVGFLANELTTYSEPDESGERRAVLKVGVARLLDHIEAVGGLDASAIPAEMIADYWWLRMTNAREPAFERGVPVPPTAEQRALMEIRLVLAPSDPKSKAGGQHSRKGKK